jgi:predicted phage terminase large subunit-like protein
LHNLGSERQARFPLGVFRRRLEYPALKRALREQQRLFNANEVLIKDKASGTQLIQELITDGCYGVPRYQPTTEKILRLHAQTALIENGFVHIPETAPWLAEYFHELTVFPKGQHDDQADPACDDKVVRHGTRTPTAGCLAWWIDSEPSLATVSARRLCPSGCGWSTGASGIGRKSLFPRGREFEASSLQW